VYRVKVLPSSGAPKPAAEMSVGGLHVRPLSAERERVESNGSSHGVSSDWARAGEEMCRKRRRRRRWKSIHEEV
jgi:hypothetical protein